MSNRLRAVVFGAGQAGQGHALALRYAGVDITGMTSRTPGGTKTAETLKIAHFSTDWRRLLSNLKPDIVSVATPGGSHVEMIAAALEAGCHVLAEKPLATTAEDARKLYDLAREKGVKTAYGASFWYQPQALYAKHLVASGQIGHVLEAECVSHLGWPSIMPFGWPHRLEEGGGRLNNGFPHMLAMVQNVLGGEVLSVMGEARYDLKQAPQGHPREFHAFARRRMTPKEAGRWTWSEVDSDWSFTALLRIGNPTRGLEEAVSCTFRHSALRQAWPDDFVAFYGDLGTVHVRGGYMQGGLYLKTDGPSWEQLGLPTDIQDELPDESNDNLRNWMCLARDFVCDIQGLDVPRYLTFRDGWIYQEAIDAIRTSSGWKALPRM
jgi:predicted dehydrogenase